MRATRRDAREFAVQILFQLDLNPQPVEKALADFWGRRKISSATRRFTEELVRGVIENREHIDRTLRQYSTNWDLHRMAAVDRNVLRLALYEMLYRPDIPPVVSINEAVDIAKYFSSSEAGRFVNGILDRVCKDLPRPPRTPQATASSGEQEHAPCPQALNSTTPRNLETPKSDDLGSTRKMDAKST
ncbi:MAG: transcription antitermination factor NusB [Kiritimatiellae bacterium]|nr:transcription antitermination factor NusB [Kiritimatiellia bacterium]